MKYAFVIATLLAAQIASATLSEADLPENTLFTLNRLNYKAQNTLIYQSVIDKAACEIDSNRPLDVYYLSEGQGDIQRIEMSKASNKYFGAQLGSIENTDSFDFTFLSLQKFESLEKESQKIHVQIEKTENGCRPIALVNYQGELLRLINIQTRVKKIFGKPAGVKWVELLVEDDKGQQATICAAGKCP